MSLRGSTGDEEAADGSGKPGAASAKLNPWPTANLPDGGARKPSGAAADMRRPQVLSSCAAQSGFCERDTLRLYNETPVAERAVYLKRQRKTGKRSAISSMMVCCMAVRVSEGMRRCQPARSRVSRARSAPDYVRFRLTNSVQITGTFAAAAAQRITSEARSGRAGTAAQAGRQAPDGAARGAAAAAAGQQAAA